MSWSVNKTGPVGAVKAEIEQEYAEHGFGNVSESEKPVTLITGVLDDIAQHPNTHVSVVAGGHSYHDGNHRQYALNMAVSTVHPDLHEEVASTPAAALA